MKRGLRTLAVAMAIAVVATAGYVWAGRAVELETARVESNVAIRVFGLGTMEARVVSRIGFEVAAAITELTADHGDTVKKGALLARLRAAEQEAKVAKAMAELLSAEVGIVKAEANVEKARAVLTQRQEANRRKQSLVDRRVVSEQTAEEALRDEEVAKSDLTVAKAEVGVAKAKLADAKSQVQIEETVLAHHELRAPFDALVIERHKELGTVIKAGDPIFTLVDASSIWVLAYVDESRAGNLREGQAAEVRLRSLPQRSFKGKITRIGIESDRVTEERKVYIACEDCPARFHLGEQVEVLISVADLPRALMVPEATVRGFDGRHATLWVIENGRLAERRVAIGHRSEDARLEVIGGLPEGSNIAVGVPLNSRIGRAVRADAPEKRP